MKKTLIASLTQEINTATPGVIQLFPAGEFRARDGRPTECAAWLMTREIAERLIAAADERETPYVLDYEHQTLRSAKNGLPAPAAAFFKSWSGAKVKASSLSMLSGPLLLLTWWRQKHIALFPRIFLRQNRSGAGVAQRRADQYTSGRRDGGSVTCCRLPDGAHLTTEGQTEMDEEFLNELLSNLRWMLNLPTASTKEEIMAELQKIITMISGGQGTAAASVSLLDI
jgi:hypothetical protein